MQKRHTGVQLGPPPSREKTWGLVAHSEGRVFETLVLLEELHQYLQYCENKRQNIHGGGCPWGVPRVRSHVRPQTVTAVSDGSHVRTQTVTAVSDGSHARTQTDTGVKGCGSVTQRQQHSIILIVLIAVTY